MSLEGQRAKSAKAAATGLALKSTLVEAEESGEYHERELRFIAAFRLRDAANRLATLVGMSRSSRLRAELVAIYDRLMAEERELLVRSMEAVDFAPPSSAPPKPAKKTA